MATADMQRCTFAVIGGGIAGVTCAETVNTNFFVYKTRYPYVLNTLLTVGFITNIEKRIDHVYVQSCIFTFFQYQPISLQYP